MYFDQLLLAARKVHVVYFDFGAVHYIHFTSNHNTANFSSKVWVVEFVQKNLSSNIQVKM